MAVNMSQMSAVAKRDLLSKPEVRLKHVRQTKLME